MNPLLLRLLIGSAMGIIVGGLVYPRGKKHAKYEREMVRDKSGDQCGDNRDSEPDRNEFCERVRGKNHAKSEHGNKRRDSRDGRNPVSKLRPADGRDHGGQSDLKENEDAEHESSTDASGDHGGNNGGGSAVVNDEPADSPVNEK